jgi:hypothetical protein
MEPIDQLLLALFVTILLYILSSDSDGGRRGRLPARI